MTAKENFPELDPYEMSKEALEYYDEPSKKENEAYEQELLNLKKIQDEVQKHHPRLGETLDPDDIENLGQI